MHDFVRSPSGIALLLLAALSAPAIRLEAQAAPSFAQAKTLYIEPFAGGSDGVLIRQSLIKRLSKSGRYQVVDSPNDADAIVKGHGEIWIKGYFTTNWKSPATNRRTVYGGFLSVQVVNKDGEPLWSYLVTPSKFVWSSIADDLANNLVKEMFAANEGETPPGVAPGKSQMLAATGLHGAGATFPAPLYQLWFESFQQQYPDVRITYDAVGSELGTRMLAENKVDFAGSDVSVDIDTPQAGTKVLRFASVLGGVVPIYNLKGITHDLKFTPETLADIYLGKITKWNDPNIRSTNKDVDLPNAGIQVIHRSDGSGTTYVWSDFLSKISPNWKNMVGTGTTLNWPVGIGVERNEGIAETVQATANSIGYVELIYAIQHDLSYGAVRNSAGEFIRADLGSLAEAAKETALGANAISVGSITNAPGKGAYPISTFTWFLVPMESNDSAKRAALIALLRWALTSGQKQCSSLGYAPLPHEIAAQQLEMLNGLK